MLDYVGTIIKNAREDARQTLSADVIGDQVLSDNALVRYCNYAIERIMHVVVNNVTNGSTYFEREYATGLVRDQAFYEVPDNVYLRERYKDVSVTDSQSQSFWRELREKDISYRRDTLGFPREYIRTQGKILLSPVPDVTGGFIRVIYDRSPDRVQTRRGLVTSTTGTPITAITLNNATFATDVDAFENQSFLCVVSPDGVVKAYNVPFTAITTTSVTVPSHTLATGETISTGDYVVPGKWTTTHPALPLICEKYITQYVVVKAFRKESSSDEGSANSELAAMETEIKDAFMSTSKDEMQIQIDNEEIMLGGGGW